MTDMEVEGEGDGSTKTSSEEQDLLECSTKRSKEKDGMDAERGAKKGGSVR